MIKASELRAGVSIVYRIQTDLDSGKQMPVLVTVTANEIKEIESRPEKHNYKPIELTPEWLERFGFDRFVDKGVVGFDEVKPDELTIWYEKGKFTIVQWGVDTPFVFSNHNLQIELKYVHQLQNLYFALTGQELELKDIAQK